jgi:hypothetical protein
MAATMDVAYKYDMQVGPPNRGISPICQLLNTTKRGKVSGNRMGSNQRSLKVPNYGDCRSSQTVMFTAD